jgi:signal transduction histidine kinase
MRLVRNAITTTTTQTCVLDLKVDAQKSTFQVQVVPCARHGALIFIHDVSHRRRTATAPQHLQRGPGGLAEQLQSAREEERARIAREIHDDMGQSLTALKIDLARLRTHLDEEPRRVDEELAAMTRSVEAMIRSVQDFATGLRPELLGDLGLPAAVAWQAEKFSECTGIDCACSVPDRESKTGAPAATALFRILQEALTNVARHAYAHHAWVSLSEDEDWATLEVLDDGRGVQVLDTGQPLALGVLGMHERAQGLGGEATVTTRPTGGTRVWARVPAQ